jgi:hypothetical protein
VWFHQLSRRSFSFQGTAYTVVYEFGYGRAAKIFQIATPLPGEVLQPPKLTATCTVVKFYGPVFLVECDSEILVIGHSDVRVSKMLVYKDSRILSWEGISL